MKTCFFFIAFWCVLLLLSCSNVPSANLDWVSNEATVSTEHSQVAGSTHNQNQDLQGADITFPSLVQYFLTANFVSVNDRVAYICDIIPYEGEALAITVVFATEPHGDYPPEPGYLILRAFCDGYPQPFSIEGEIMESKYFPITPDGRETRAISLQVDPIHVPFDKPAVLTFTWTFAFDPLPPEYAHTDYVPSGADISLTIVVTAASKNYEKIYTAKNTAPDFISEKYRGNQAATISYLHEEPPISGDGRHYYIDYNRQEPLYLVMPAQPFRARYVLFQNGKQMPSFQGNEFVLVSENDNERELVFCKIDPYILSTSGSHTIYALLFPLADDFIYGGDEELVEVNFYMPLSTYIYTLNIAEEP